MGLILDLTRDTYSDKVSIVRVGNTNYKTFKAYSVSRSLDDVCGTFEIEISRPEKGVNPFKTDQVIDIQLDNTQIMRGKIYDVSLKGDAYSDTILISGRDIIGDIVDSTVPDDAKVFSGGVGLFDIAFSILKALGAHNLFSIKNHTGETITPFSAEEIVTCETGDTVIEFLLKYCAKRQIFLTSNPYGDLVFFKAQGETTGNVLINKLKSNKNNVISYQSKFNIAERFYKYICKSQDSDGWGGGNVDTGGTALDTGMSIVRQREFKMEEGGLAKECEERAKEEANIQRARGFEYQAVVQGFKDKVLWKTDQFVKIFDEKCSISGEYLVKSVEYSLTNDTGRTTKLVCTHRDAYTLQASIDKRSKTGIGWVND
jgi:prophage tail gpP-like protein